MNTRTERMNNKEYCAYCGKELRSYGYCTLSLNLPLVCDCEKAKRELELYDELKVLHSLPLAETLIDMKVKEYRDKLLGVYNPTTVTTATLGSPITINGGTIVNAEYTSKDVLN